MLSSNNQPLVIIINYNYRYKKSPGHLGCSSGFNSLNYKPYMPPGFNSQGREQCNSLLEKISGSLKQMNFVSYMTML